MTCIMACSNDKDLGRGKLVILMRVQMVVYRVRSCWDESIGRPILLQLFLGIEHRRWQGWLLDLAYLSDCEARCLIESTK